jgi:hypothetical protein
VSVDHSADGNIDITTESRDVTVSWSILSGTTKNMLIKYNPARVTLHHNLFVDNGSRNPQARIDDAGGQARQTTLDMRNNVIANWVGYGTLVWEGAWANVVANYYGAGKNAVAVERARAWVADNLTAGGVDVNGEGTEAAPFPAPPVTTTDACTAAREVLADAGVRPLDALDQSSVSRVPLTRCGGGDPVVAPPRPDPAPPAVGATSAPAVAGPPPAAAPPSSPANADGSVTAELAIASPSDDGNEYDGGRVYATRSLLAIGGRALLGLRFAGVTIPRGAQVLSAVLEIVPAGNVGRPTHLYYLGEDAGDSAPLGTDDGAFSARPKTRAFVGDVPAPWRKGEAAASPDLAAVVQEIVDHPGWAPGNGLTLFVGGDGSGGERLVAAYESRPSPSLAARLVITYR